MVKDENFITVQGWMVNDLGLSGSELLIYALIYGFSQDGSSEFTGSLAYIAEWCNVSKVSAISRLKSLCDKGFLEKRELPLSCHSKLVYYKAIKPEKETGKETLPPVKKHQRSGKETLPGQLRNFTDGGKETLPNNINKYIDKDIYNSSSSEPDEEEEDDEKTEAIKNRINYDDLIAARPDDRSQIDEIVGLIVEVISSKSMYIIVSSVRYEAEVVKSRFMKLNYNHINFVLDRMETSDSKIRYMHQYLKAALFNAPTEIESYYKAAVRYDAANR